MFAHSTRWVSTLVCAAVLSTLTASDCLAFNCWRNCWGSAPTTVGYTPQVVGYTPQVVNFAPAAVSVTSYRVPLLARPYVAARASFYTTYMPTTTFMPVSACSTCAAMPVTTFRPVVSFSPVCSPCTSCVAPTCSSCIAPSCSTCPSTVSYAAPAVSSGCSSCTANYSTTITPIPSSTPAAGSADAAPELSTTPPTQQPQTFVPSETVQPHSSMRQADGKVSPAGSILPAIGSPQDRMTWRNSAPAKLVSYTEPAAPTPSPRDNSYWRASR
ncbi:MAG: hypothetical protein ACOY3P_14915 [Planctomycetota bacterium]